MDLLNLQTWFNLSIARESRDLNNAALANTQKTVYEQIAAQYYSCQLMGEAVRLARISEQVADSVYQSVSVKFEQGLVNMASVDVASINLQRAAQTAETATYQARIARNNIKALLGFSVTDSVEVSDGLSTFINLDPAQPFVEDPALLMARYQQQLSLGQLRSARSAVFPVVTVAYSNSTQHNANIFEPFKSVPDWYPASFWSLRASWNIFTGGSRWLNVQRNKINYQQTTAQYEAQLKQSAINDDNLRLSYLKASAAFERSKNIMRLSLDNYGHISERYATGISSLDDRLNAYADYLTFQNQYLNSLSELLVQVYKIKIRQK
jgi:outer membrane protein TolC